MKTILMTAAVAALPAAAPAATFDFGALGTAFADANGFEGSWNEVTDWSQGTPGTWTVDGIGVTTSTDATYVHVDSDWSLGPDSGIGPCGIGDCNASEEDGFGPGETITLTFSQPVAMTSLLLRQSDPNRGETDPDHTQAQGAFTLDGEIRSVTDGVVSGPLGSGTTWMFGYATADYYISTAVVDALPQSPGPDSQSPAPIPIPASALLLGAALGGLGLARRRAARR